MKNILVLLLLSLLFSCTSNSSKKDQLEVNETFENIVTKTDTNHSIESKFTEVSVNHFKSEKYDKLLEKDTVNLILQYYGWGCPCPQWINPDSLVKFHACRH